MIIEEREDGSCVAVISKEERHSLAFISGLVEGDDSNRPVWKRMAAQAFEILKYATDAPPANPQPLPESSQETQEQPDSPSPDEPAPTVT